MSTKTLLTVIGACAFATAVSAQAQSTASTSSSQMASTSITVQGCIERGAPMPSSTAGATGTAGSTEGFVLSNASQAPAAASAPNTAGTSGSMNVATSYRLDATDATLTPHVGHKVEIKGTVESASPAASASSSASSTTASSSSSAPKLKVDSVKMIASSCSAQ
jgi:hypothetical protein